MAAICYLITYLAAGVWMVRCLLPAQRPLVRMWLGAALGVMLLMWLPTLCAMALAFTLAAHGAALVVLAALCAACYIARDWRIPTRFAMCDRGIACALAAVALPLTVLSGYLQYTHTLMNINGALYVGQSTYGDLAMHLSFVSGFPQSAFPPDYSILTGEKLCYPFLVDAMSASLYMLGLSLSMSLVIPGTLMMLLCFAGYLLFAQRACGKTRVAVLAALFFFLNGGLGFLYTLLDTRLGATLNDRLHDVMYGYYRTPTNHADQAIYNLRWSNVIADMMIPQRTTLAGWCALLPCMYLMTDGFMPAADRRAPALAPGMRHTLLLGVMTGMLPMIHTHSFLAAALMSAGMVIFAMAAAQKGTRRRAFLRWATYGAVAVCLSVPQLIEWTFSHAVGNDSFVRVHFNWVNQVNGALRDEYFWFYLKNIGLPLLAGLAGLLLAVRDFRKKGDARMLFLLCGAFFVFIPAELLVFQPNVYDNNKLFYVWYMLFAVAAANTCVRAAQRVWRRFSGVGARAALTALFAVLTAACFLSAGLTLARECESRYQAFGRQEADAASFARDNTQPGDVFITGTQHLNPIASLAGRDIVCGPDLWLYNHGYDTTARQADIARFYANPADNMDVLTAYGVDYIYVSQYERSDWGASTASLDQLFERVYQSQNGEIVIYKTEEGAEYGSG